ncbi:MAG: hypothetical protein ACLFMS_05430 [Halorhodospira sp.]
MANQHPEQAARDAIDGQLREAGWVIQGRRSLDPQAGRGVAVREYPTDAGPMDYLFLVDVSRRASSRPSARRRAST